MFLIFGSPNQIVNSRRAGARGGTLSARKVQTRNACFHQLRARTVPVQIWGAEHKIKNDPKQVVVYFGSPNQIRTGVLALKGRCPRPLDDGAKTAGVLNFYPKRRPIIIGISPNVKAFMPIQDSNALFCRNRFRNCISWDFFNNFCFDYFGGWFNLLKYDFFAVGVFQCQTAVCQVI